MYAFKNVIDILELKKTRDEYQALIESITNYGISIHIGRFYIHMKQL